MSELRSSLRGLRRNPAFTIIAVLTMALGIGANTAIFSVVEAVLLNPLPYTEPHRLVAISETAPDMPDNQLSDPFTAADWQARSHSFESMAMYIDAAGVLVENGEGEIVRALRVSSGFFSTLGVRMQLGREFLPDEDRPDRRFTVVILSDGLWKRRFGGDPHIVGRVIQLSSAHYAVVGVLPREFKPLLHGNTELLPEMYMPAGFDYSSVCRRCLGPHTVARLKKGVGVDEARAELTTIMHSIVREHGSDYDRGAGVSIVPMRDFLLGRVSVALWAVLGSVGFVLLIACTNVANLLLARASAHSRDLVLRAALGAERWHLARLLFTDSLILGLTGGAIGFALALWGSGALASAFPQQIPRIKDVQIDWMVLVFTIAASVITAILCGIAPAWYATNMDLNDALKVAGRGSTDQSRKGLRRVLVATEFALAFVLVTGALLMGKSYLRLMSVNPGYDPQNVLTLTSTVWGSRYSTEAAFLNYYEQTLKRLATLPGIESAAWTNIMPLDFSDPQRIHLEGRPTVSESEAPLVDFYSVSADYFRVLKIQLKRGRLFTAQDRFKTLRVALLSESCARSLFPGEDPLGKHIQFGDSDPKKPWVTVIGVVGDVRQYRLDKAPNMEAYVAQAQGVVVGYYRLVARTTVPSSRMERPVRELFRSVDPMLPVYHVKSLEEYLAGTVATRTVTLALLGLFSLLALMLAAVGVYGVISYTVTLRTREIGVRMALGAGRCSILAMVLRDNVVTIIIGVAVGLAASLPLTRLLESLLFEVKPIDVVALSTAAVVLVGTALLGSCLPARSAAATDPMVALRGD